MPIAIPLRRKRCARLVSAAIPAYLDILSAKPSALSAALDMSSSDVERWRPRGGAGAGAGSLADAGAGSGEDAPSAGAGATEELPAAAGASVAETSSEAASALRAPAFHLGRLGLGWGKAQVPSQFGAQPP